jgi:hypothetical protein
MGLETGTAANPAAQRQGAEILDQAAGLDVTAGRTISTGRPADAAPFGISAQARDLANLWDAAVNARMIDTANLAAGTHQLADELREAADEYQRSDENSAQKIGDVGHGLGRPIP